MEKWSGANARIAIDPLTPVIWSTPNRYDQRELITILMKELKKIGTVVCTLEEYETGTSITNNETIIPMYLADSVIRLKFLKNTEDQGFERYLEILKCRNSRHTKFSHKYLILHGFGIMIHSTEDSDKATHKVTNLLKRNLNKEKQLSKKELSMITQYLNSLTDKDFDEMDPQVMLKNIVEEYL